MRRIVSGVAGWALPVLIAGLMLLILLRPVAAMEGALSGLGLWARNVLPALLPYFILSQLLIESGAVNALGRGLSPVMRVFRLPGDAGPALLLSWISGSPSGARITGMLHEQGALDSAQAARLCASAAMTGPLFLVGSVGGMLGDARAGTLLLTACLLAALANGLVWRCYGHYGSSRSATQVFEKNPLAALPAALRDGAAAVIAVGAGIALFSVILRLFYETGIMDVLIAPLRPIMGKAMAQAIAAGFLELTNGCALAAELPLPLAQRTAVAAGIAGFGGLSVAAQAAVFLGGRMRMGVYILQRLTQAALSVLCVFALHPLFLPEIAASANEAKGAGWCALCLVIFLLAVIVAALILRMIYRPGGVRPSRHPRRRPASGGSGTSACQTPQGFPVSVSRPPGGDFRAR